MYLAAIIDWYSRYIVGYGLSNTLEKAIVIETINKAVKTHGTPEIMNSDQGSQFSSREYVELLKENGIKICMDSKGRALDNQRIERFFRSYKWEKLYSEECEISQIFVLTTGSTVVQKRRRRRFFWNKPYSGHTKAYGKNRLWHQPDYLKMQVR